MQQTAMAEGLLLGRLGPGVCQSVQRDFLRSIQLWHPNNVQTLTDANFEQTVNQPASRCSWTSGRSGAAPAGGWRRRSTRSPPTTTARSSVGKLNVDENPTTPMRFSIRGIPTLLLFKGGQIVE